MADSAVAITAGSGTNVDTRTEGTNSNHRQVIVIGDPATNAGVAPVDVTAGLKVDLGADNDVAVTSIVPGTGATNLGKAVDVAAGASDVGVLQLAVRDDALAALTPVDGDYTQLRVDGTGAQWVRQTNPATGTQSSVSDSATSVTILASNASRRGASVFNDSSAILYLLVGAGTASTTAYTVKIASGGYYEVPAGYTGILVGIWASDPNDGAARVTEFT